MAAALAAQRKRAAQRRRREGRALRRLDRALRRRRVDPEQRGAAARRRPGHARRGAHLPARIVGDVVPGRAHRHLPRPRPRGAGVPARELAAAHAVGARLLRLLPRGARRPGRRPLGRAQAVRPASGSARNSEPARARLRQGAAQRRGHPGRLPLGHADDAHAARASPRVLRIGLRWIWAHAHPQATSPCAARRSPRCCASGCATPACRSCSTPRSRTCTSRTTPCAGVVVSQDGRQRARARAARRRARLRRLRAQRRRCASSTSAQPIGSDWTVGAKANTGDGILAGERARRRTRPDGRRVVGPVHPAHRRPVVLPGRAHAARLHHGQRRAASGS